MSKQAKTDEWKGGESYNHVRLPYLSRSAVARKHIGTTCIDYECFSVLLGGSFYEFFFILFVSCHYHFQLAQYRIK